MGDVLRKLFTYRQMVAITIQMIPTTADDRAAISSAAVSGLIFEPRFLLSQEVPVLERVFIRKIYLY